MAKQRYNTSIDSLSYAESKVPYVAPPTKEILSLLDSREDRYLKSKQNIDLAKELSGSLPHADISKDTYNQMIEGINNSIAGINKDNYADSELDTAQLALDVKTKWGGKQLADQAADLAAKSKIIEEEKDIRPDKKAWYANRLTNSLQPVTKQPDGTFNSGLPTLPPMFKDQDLTKDADAIMSGWKADGLYSYNEDGTITADTSILGKYGLTKTTGIKPEDVMEAAINYLSVEPTKKSYINDEAAFELRNMNITPDNVLNMMSPAVKKRMFPDKIEGTVTANDIIDAVGGSREGLAEFARVAKANDIKNNVAKVLGAKYGYQDVDKSFVDNIEEMEQIKAKYAKKSGKEGEDDNGMDLGQLVQVMPAYTVTHASPLVYEGYKKQEVESVKSYVSAREDYLRYQEESDAADARGDKTTVVNLKESLNRSKARMEQADEDLRTTREAQKSLTKSTIEVAKGQGIDVNKTYTQKVQQEALKEIKTQNIQNLANAGFTVNLDNFKIKSSPYNNNIDDFNLKPQEVISINLPGYENKRIPVYTDTDLTYKRMHINEVGAIKRNGKYELIMPSMNNIPVTPNVSDFISRLSNQVGYTSFKDLGNKYKTSKDSTKNIKLMPRLEDYQQAVSELVMNKDADINHLPKAVQKEARKTAENISKKVDKSNITVNQTLDYLYVDKEAKKGTAAKRLLDLTQSLDENLISQGSQYKVYDPTGKLVDLPLMLKDLGISYTEDDIDFTNTKTSVILDNDRKYGQKLRLPFRLTKSGREKLLEDHPEMLDNSGTLNLVGVNIAGINSGFNKNLVDGITAAYAESFGNRMPGGEQERNAYGKIKFDNSPSAKSFYDLNLYTLENGGKRDYSLPNGEKLTINAIKRSSAPTKIGDNDFYLTKPNGDVMVIDNKDGQSKFIRAQDYANDTTGTRYNRRLFASPGDIAGLIGREYLSQEVTRSNSNQAKNNQVKTSGGSYNVTPVGVTSDKHRSNQNNTYKTYGTKAKPVQFRTSNGQTVSLNSRIPARDLFDISNQIPNQYSSTMLPYLNTAVAPNAVKIIKGYGLYATSAFRDENRNAKAGGTDNSLHQYGKSLDAKYDTGAAKLIEDLKNNPQLAQDLGISMAFKEEKDGGTHLHIDFI